MKNNTISKLLLGDGLLCGKQRTLINYIYFKTK